MLFQLANNFETWYMYNPNNAILSTKIEIE